MSQKLHNPKSHAPAVYIPCWLIQVPIKLLSHGAKMTYGRLSQWADEMGHAFRSAKQLGEELGTSHKSIEKYIQELKEANLIGTYHPQAGGVNHFEFYDHPWMHEPIKEQLVYKKDNFDPPSNLREPHLKLGGTPPSNLRDINNKEIKEIKLCGAKPSHTDNSLKSLKKQNAEQSALNDPKIKELFEAKFHGIDVTLEQLFNSCREHYEQKSLWVTKDRFMKWVKLEKLDNYSKPGSGKVKPPENETDEERQNRQFVTNEIMKENDGSGYVSALLQKRPELREKYAKYAR